MNHAPSHPPVTFDARPRSTADAATAAATTGAPRFSYRLMPEQVGTRRGFPELQQQWTRLAERREISSLQPTDMGYRRLAAGRGVEKRTARRKKWRSRDKQTGRMRPAIAAPRPLVDTATR